MALGRPTDFTPTMGEEILQSKLSAHHLDFKHPKWKGVKESEWCAFAMENQKDWVASLGIEPFDRYELEHQVSIRSKGERSKGLPRIAYNLVAALMLCRSFVHQSHANSSV